MRKALFISIATLGTIGSLLASQQGNAEIVDEAFGSELVHVVPKSDRKSITLLERPVQKVKCGAKFLVGKCVDGGWRDGDTVWIQIDDIAEIVEEKR